MKARAFIPLSFNRRERGVALFISLVLLLVLTIIGVSSVQTTSLETRMARNEHDTLLAFQAAELALKDAEVWLRLNVDSVDDTDAFTDGGGGGLWTVAEDPGDDDPWEDGGVWTGGGSVVAPTNPGAVVAEPPRYLIEHLGDVTRSENPWQLNPDYPDPVDRIAMFRITSRGVGGSANAQVLLQGTFGILVD
ncbi:MAG: PilX N-terminal domain-containing pilus assembly protein [Pseudomonadales bacterium]